MCITVAFTLFGVYRIIDMVPVNVASVAVGGGQVDAALTYV
jgi:hypothetical protein